jgi:cation diffusion facilitator CzcD-associated flavoprotein CzcO
MIIETKILIIGAGFTGLGAAIKLLKAGRDEFVVIERRADVGGVWYDNNYPGIACDVPSHFYSFSFRLNPNWSTIQSPGGEILDYLRDCAREEGILPYIRFNTEMLDSRWDAEARHWVVKTNGDTYHAKYLLTGAGHLADEFVPDIEGLDTFPGHVFHSARWDHSIDLNGKRIGVVGSGASAVQIVPEMQKIATELVVFQRSAPYMNMRNLHLYSEAEQRTFERNPDVMEHLRAWVFWFGEEQYAQRRMVPKYIEDARQVAMAHMENQVADPELRKKLTPDYQIGCKRRLSSSGYYPAVASSNVTVETSALARVEGSKAFGVSGEGYELDALIFATGFEAVRMPFTMRIFNAEGVSLDQQWDNGMQALDAIAVTGFPNLFIIYGPNTGLGNNSAVYVIESQVDYVISALDHLEANQLSVFQAKADAEEEFMDHLHEVAEGTVWLDGGCRSWYVDERSGRLTVIWPDFPHVFREELSQFHPERYELSA